MVEYPQRHTMDRGIHSKSRFFLIKIMILRDVKLESKLFTKLSLFSTNMHTSIRLKQHAQGYSQDKPGNLTSFIPDVCSITNEAKYFETENGMLIRFSQEGSRSLLLLKVIGKGLT